MRRSSFTRLQSAVLLTVFAAGCSLADSSNIGRDTIAIVSYNVQNLFDPEDSGNEYPEFSVASGKWDAGLYAKRLGNVKKAIASLLPAGKPGPDVLCLVEIENRRVLEDLRKGPFSGAGYKAAIISPSEGAAINSGILTRFPVVESRAHALAGLATPGRNILEATLAVSADSTLTVLLCHWKSRKEGAEATEDARLQAANLVRRRISELLMADPRAEIVICGDFNESPDEFTRIGKKYATAFTPVPVGGPVAADAEIRGLFIASRPGDAVFEVGIPVVFSPWALSDGYSYVYKGERERLDGFLLSPGLCDGDGLTFGSFTFADAGFLVSDGGAPLGWRGQSGYSDHLPIMLALIAGKKNKLQKDRSIVYDSLSGLH